MIFKTVGDVYHRYRLAHQWVAEKLLNVQSESLRLLQGSL